MEDALDAVFKALADANRRRLLDSLNARNGQTLTDLGSGLEMSRQAVSKHLAILEDARLVVTARRGREKLHYLNAEPINDIADRWIDRYIRHRARALADLKHALEETTMSQAEFVYVTYIKTTPERLWQALTDPEFARQYWGDSIRSDWEVGSKVLWRSVGEESFEDLGMEVLESNPPHKLSYTWFMFQRRHAEYFGWSEEKLPEVLEERRS